MSVFNMSATPTVGKDMGEGLPGGSLRALGRGSFHGVAMRILRQQMSVAKFVVSESSLDSAGTTRMYHKILQFVLQY